MKLRISGISASILAFAVVTMLAACGGGGGSVPAPNPTGGNGGGGSPTPTPSSSASPTPSPSPTPTSTPAGTTVSAEENFVNGSFAWYTSGTSSWSTSSGGTSSAPGASATVDGLSCHQYDEQSLKSQNVFWQHVFVGIYDNGTWEALPQALGMVAPVAPTQGTPSHPTNTDEVEQNQCEFNMHTHDFSGLVHLIDPTMPESNTFPSWANLGTLFDVWGAQLTSNGISAGSSSLAGTTTIYTGTPSTQVNGADEVTSYTAYSGTPASLQFTRHMAVWIVIGSPPSGGLPNVVFHVVN